MKFIQGETNYEEWRDHAKDNEQYKKRMATISSMLPKKDKLTFADEIALVMCIICKDCYAAAGCARFSGLCQGLETNFLILNNFLISAKAWAILAIPSLTGCARIEAHGDVATEICAINYNRIVESHKHLTFTVWSKNLNIWKTVFETEGKPDNMIFVASSPIVNEVMDVPEDMKKYVDHVFTVFDKEYAIKHNININCGTWNADELDHRCKLCMRCYDKLNKDYYINELKK